MAHKYLNRSLLLVYSSIRKNDEVAIFAHGKRIEKNFELADSDPPLVFYCPDGKNLTGNVYAFLKVDRGKDQYIIETTAGKNTCIDYQLIKSVAYHADGGGKLMISEQIQSRMKKINSNLEQQNQHVLNSKKAVEALNNVAVQQRLILENDNRAKAEAVQKYVRLLKKRLKQIRQKF